MFRILFAFILSFLLSWRVTFSSKRNSTLLYKQIKATTKYIDVTNSFKASVHWMPFQKWKCMRRCWNINTMNTWIPMLHTFSSHSSHIIWAICKCELEKNAFKIYYSRERKKVSQKYRSQLNMCLNSIQFNRHSNVISDVNMYGGRILSCSFIGGGEMVRSIGYIFIEMKAHCGKTLTHFIV